MAYHFIAVASYYAGGKRIGWHYASNDNLDKAIIQDFFEQSQHRLSKSEFGIHKLITEDKSWKSVVKKDSFFKDISVIEDMDAFFNLLSADKKMHVEDVAKFFLSIGSITNLKLQKLIYFAYATHLKNTGKKLFEERIIAYKYGPVVEEVYQLYKGYGREKIDQECEKKFMLKDIRVPLVFAKIALNEDAVEILASLTETVQKYWKLSASQLVEISHVDGGPWDLTYDEFSRSKVIKDEFIKEYHYKELEKLS